jgi:hypothetical protein
MVLLPLPIQEYLVNNEVERYVGELQELRKRVAELEQKLGVPNAYNSTTDRPFFYNILKERGKKD